ncbi:MAG: VanZ family protein [bacterium]|nr:VanZ family protein [bacterium]
MRLRHQKAWLAGGVLLLLLVAWGSLTPTPPQGPQFAGADKVNHLAAYWFLGWYFAQLLPWGNVTLGLFGYGLLIESLQGLSGYRFFEWADLAANGTGLALGLFAAAGAGGRALAWIETLRSPWNSG